ncbi:S-layer homology domain-containing protein [uncultured Slackia sp.]|uniref:S-layer homology domain-containing protein n=1 Tax=uncultured Slackia sp. TaxID=665903 RepID=UPI0026DFF2FA|nr:S-layer homology domain-containing protein [uncultured Slackia sp.]
MTAYVNDEQKKEGAYGKAVKATLAATLAAGMVPAAAAFADEPAEATAEGNDVEVLWAGDADNFKGGQITKVKDQNDKVYEVADGKITVKAGAVTALTIAEFQYADGTFATAEQLKKIEFTQPGTQNYNKPGTYKGFKATETDNSWTSLEFAVVVEANELEGVTLYNNSDSKNDVKNASFTYSADKFVFGLAKDGKNFTDASVDGVYAADDTFLKTNLKDKELAAGSYNVVVKGSGNYVDSSIILSLTVDKFDISKSDLTIKDAAVAEQDKGTIVSPSGSVPQNVIAKLKATGDSLPVKVGAYSATIASADEKNASIVGTKKVDYVIAEEMLTKFAYGADWTTPVVVDLSDEKPAYFDASKVVVKNADDDVLKQGEDYELVVTDKDGKAATLDDLKKPGSWLVYVKAIPGKDFTYAGMSGGLEVNVKAGDLTDANLVLKFDDALSNGTISTEYTGENILDRIDVVVTGKDGKELVNGTDYKVVVKDSKDAEVDEVVAVGNYTLGIEAEGYEITGTSSATIEVTTKTVKKPQLANETVTIVKGDKDSDPNKAPNDPADLTGIPYTGGEIALELKYFAGKVDGKDTYKPLDASEYTYTLKKDGKSVESILEPGKYEVTVKDAKGGNFDVNGTVWLRVIDEKVFLDVPTTEWYYDEVLTAYQNGWIKGYSGGNFFGPNDAVTRADVCVTLARMADVDLEIDATDENAGSEVGFFETPFADVDGNMYYAQAVAWAAKAGIVSGDTGTGNFRPTDQISREEFAAMLARYAEKNGGDVNADASALDKYEDASSVSGWAKGYVAWAVEAGIMGKDTSVLWPTENITRAAVATMLVRL